jgi:peptide/nickel transport system permease protein
MSTTEMTQPKGRKVETFAGLVWKRFKKHRLALISSLILIGFILSALLAGLYESILDVSYESTNLRNRYGPYDWPHLLGTDDVGRDVMARLLYGGRVSLAVGIISALSSATIGTVIGLLAGYFGGLIDSALMRFTDAMLSVPVLPLMIVFAAIDLEKLLAGAGALDDALFVGGAFLVLALIASFFRHDADTEGSRLKSLRDGGVAGLIGGLVFAFLYVVVGKLLYSAASGAGNMSSVLKIILIIVFFGWMTVARLARAAALQIKNMEFVTAARALGGSNRRILLSHVLPNAMAPIIVAATLEVGGNILYEAALSFLGLGIQPPVPSWGNMLNLALDYIKQDPLLAFWPGLFILVCVACFNFFGDGMRDALDPHQVMKDK